MNSHAPVISHAKPVVGVVYEHITADISSEGLSRHSSNICGTLENFACDFMYARTSSIANPCFSCFSCFSCIYGLSYIPVGITPRQWNSSFWLRQCHSGYMGYKQHEQQTQQKIKVMLVAVAVSQKLRVMAVLLMKFVEHQVELIQY